MGTGPKRYIKKMFQQKPAALRYGQDSRFHLFPFSLTVGLDTESYFIYCLFNINIHIKKNNLLKILLNTLFPFNDAETHLPNQKDFIWHL